MLYIGLFLVIAKCIHLEGLNLICHVFAQFTKIERSFWRQMVPASLLITLYIKTSSA